MKKFGGPLIGMILSCLAVSAIAGGGLQFDGVDDYVTMGAAPELGSDVFTVETWFQRTGTGSGASTGTGGVVAIPLVAKGRGEADGNNRDMNYLLGIRESDGVLVADFEEGASGSSPGLNHPVIGVTAVTSDVWHHAAVTYDGSKWRLFLDGVLDAELVVDEPPRGDSIQHAALGSALNSSGSRSGSFAGILDEVRIWNYARSESQISNSLHLEILAEAGLQGRWALDETSGTTAVDSSGSNADGTLTNGPQWGGGYQFVPLPTVTLISPADQSIELGPDVTFICDAADASDLASATLYVGLAGGQLAAVETKVISGVADTVSFTTALADGQNYDWNCLVTNSAGGQRWATAGFGLTVDANYPDLPILVAPSDGAVDVLVPPSLEVQVSDPNADLLSVSFFGRDTQPQDFTIAALPDTQYYVSGLNGGTPAMFTDQADWIVANREANNIVFVSHLGDVVQNGDVEQSEWFNATDAMYRLEYPSQRFPYGIPYGIAIGNHDQTPIGDPDGTTAFYNQYFGEANFAGRSYYGGHYGSDNDNNYQLVSASGVDLIFVHLEFDAAANPLVLAWADGLLQTYSDRLAIVSTHYLADVGDPAEFGPQGQAIYDALKANPNLTLMLGGHRTGEVRRVDTFNGNTVHSLVADFQNGANGGDGWMRLLEFSPATDEIRVKTYSPTLDQFDTDAESEFTLSVALNPGFRFIGENQDVASGATTSLPWSNAELDSDYEWFVTVTDSTGRQTQGSIWGFDTAGSDSNPPIISGVAAINVTDHAAEIIWTTDEVASSLVDYGSDQFYGSQESKAELVASHSVVISNLALGQTYHYMVRSVDGAGNASDGIDLTFTTATEDLTPPTPSPMGWVAVPTSVGPNSISMTASTASDSSGVEYYFQNVTDPSHDSAWQSGATYTDTGLLPESSYTYRVKARDQSPTNNETGYSAQAGATTGAGSAIVTRGPYLQNGKPDGVSIMWRTDNFTDGRIWYGDSPSNLDQVVDEPVPPTPLIARGATWSFLDDGSDQGTVWKDPAFNDSGWSQGLAQLGYGDGDEATVVSFGPSSSSKYATTYFRHKFTVSGAAGITALELGLVRDDGAVVYLNGTELRRDNLAGGAIGFGSFATSAIGGTSESIFYVTSVDPALLLEGDNVIAVEIHQANQTSSDISFDLEFYQPQPAGGGDGFDHLVRLGGLDSDTTYYYQVGTAQGEVLVGGDPDHHFVTLPTPGSTRPVRIWALGDSGTADSNARAVRDAYLGLAAIEQPADMLLMLGDNAYSTGTDSEYQNAVFQNMYEDILRNRVLWSTQGNHDTGAYFDIFDLPIAGEAGGVASGTEDYYSIDYANVHLICLSSQDLTLSSDPNGPMYQWLNADLLATTQPWIIAYFHHPAYTKGSHDSDNAGDSGGRMEDMRSTALPILEAGGVDLVLSGHSHSYERSMFINGHYGLSATFDAGTHVVQTGDGDPAGDGAYTKSSEDGAVYITAGSSGKIAGVGQHSAMQIWLNHLGSVIIDVDNDRLDVRFLRELNPLQIDDVFQITKNLGPDLDPPAPDPMTWASVPAAVDSMSITMAAAAATDPSGVEYLFENLTILGRNSGWQISESWVDVGLDPATAYNYQVTARDQSPARNQTAPSTTASASTDPDASPPTPNEMTWAVVPTAVDTKSITMTATTANDVSGVEYQFTRLNAPGFSSAWQASPTFVDSDLESDTTYFYQVAARDLSPAMNATDPSITVPATTFSDGVTINQATGQADPTNTGPIQFTVVFAQAVTGFDTGDVTLGGTAGATVGTVTAVDATTYNVAVSGMIGEGTVTVSLAAGVALDPAGDGNAASSSSDNLVNYDSEGPTVTIDQAAGQADPASAGPINFTVIFSESVDDFATGDVTMGGSAGATTATVTGSGTTYNVAVAGMSASGSVIASVGAGIANDAVGNPNTASTSTDNNVTFDLDVPTVSSIVRASATPTGATSVDYTVNFSESVSGVDASDFSVALTGTASGSISVLSGSGTTYTVTVSGVSGDGTLGMNLVDDDTVVDAAANPLGGAGGGNGDFAGELYSVDQTAPTVAISSAVGEATNASPIALTITFSEPVADFDLGDISVTGGTLGGFSGSGASYAVDLTPTGEGPLTVDIAGGVASDAAGNANSGAPQFGATYDATAPDVVSVVRASGTPTNATSVGYTVSFSEPVSDIDVGDFDLTLTGTVTGTVSSVSSVSGTSVTVTVSGVTGTGTLRLDVSGSAAITDAAGNAMSGGYIGGEVYDVDQDAAAVMSIARASTTPTGAASVDYTATFSELVTGVDVSDFAVVVTGTATGTISGVSGSGATYTVTIASVGGDGTLGLNLVDDDSIIDATSNPLGGSGAGDGNFTGEQYTIDQSGPSVVISTAVGDPTNNSPIAVTITFSEPVADFELGDVVAVGGSLGGFGGAGAGYTAELTPAGDGQLTVGIAAGVASDAAGNANSAAPQFAITYDATDPAVASIVRASGTPTGATSVAYTVTFGELVTGLDVSDFALAMTDTAVGTISGIAGGGTSYTVTVTGVSGEGTLGLNLVDDDTIADAASNLLGGAGAGNGDFVGEQYTLDQTGPTVTISSVAGDPTNVSPIAISITFSEPVSDFEVGDMTTTGGVLGGFAGSGAGYTAELTPSGDGPLTVDIAAGVANDAAGNANTAAAQFAITYDATDPTVASIARATGAATGATSVDFAVAFTELVSGVDVSDFSLAATGTASGTISGVAGVGSSYTVTISSISGDGTLGLNLGDDDSIVDVTGNSIGGTGAGNGNFTGEVYTIDQSAPAVVISSDSSEMTSDYPIILTITFSEPVDGFVVGDISAAGGTLVGFAGSGADYTANLTPFSQGLLSVDVAAGAASDAAGNDNTAASQFTITYDGTAPVVASIVRASESPTGAATVDYTATFTEAVTGVDASDFALAATGTASGTVSNVVGDGTSYTVTVSVIGGDGTLGLNLVDDDTIIDATSNVLGGDDPGNGNFSGELYTIDQTAPTVVIGSAVGDPTNVSPIALTITFSEAVTDFLVGDVIATGGTLGGFAGSGTDYSVILTPSTEGSLTVDIAGAVANDAAGNHNAAAAQFAITYDGTAPALASIVRASTTPTGEVSLNYTATFTELVTGVDMSDFALATTGTTTGTVSGVSGSGTSYTVTVSGVGGDGTLGLNLVDDDTVVDATTNPLGGAGTGNGNFSGELYTIDQTAPTVAISSAVGAATNASPVALTITFSEPVADFVVGDITVVGGTLGGFSGADADYTMNLTPSGDGLLTVDVGGGVAIDAAGNPNTAAAQFTVNYDATDPAVASIVRASVTPTGAVSLDYTVTFSEPVVGVDPSDFALAVTDTALGTISGVAGGTTIYTVTVTGVSGAGTLGLNLVDDDTIADAATNLLGGAGAGGGNFTGEQYAIDQTGPGVTIDQAVGQLDPSNHSVINFTVIFDEAVTGFATGDVTLGGTAGATVGTVSAVDAMTYNVAVSGMSSDGTVTVNIPAGAAEDGIGNASAASSSTDAEVSYDATGPAVTVDQAIAQADPTNSDTINFTVEFGEDVTGFATGDAVLGGTAGATTGTVTPVDAATYNIAVSGMIGDGTVIVTIPAGAADDAVGNASAASSSTDAEVSYDATGPAVTIEQAAGQADPTNSDTINFTVEFDEAVTGFASGDVALGGTAGATIGLVTAIDAMTYNLAVSGMAGDGTVTVNVPAGAADDAIGNASVASSSADAEVSYDATAPAVTIDQAAGQADPTNDVSISFTVIFDEAVTGFATGDVTLGGTAGATAGIVTAVDEKIYNVVVSGMSGDGTVTVAVPAGVATDAAGNASASSSSADAEVSYDGTGPSVTIDQAVGQVDPSNAGVINFTVEFDEAVTGFATGDVTLGGTAGATTGTVTPLDANTYNVAVSGMTGDGTVTASLPAGVAFDAVGNASAVSSSADAEVSFDQTAPAVTINQAVGQADPASAGPINFTVEFSEAVTGFTTGDVVIGGTAGATTGAVTALDARTYNVEVTDMTGLGTVTANIPVGVATDAAGNVNAASSSSDNSVTLGAADPVELFADGFESGNLTAGGWTTENNSAAAKTSATSTGTWGAELKRATWMERSVSTANYDSIELTYSRQTAGFDNGEELLVEWSVVGGVWNLIESTKATSYLTNTFELPAGAADNAAFKVRFTTNGNRNNEKARIDDVQITGIPTAPPAAPGQASAPIPSDGVSAVSAIANLSWTPGSGAVSHDVYFGINPTPGAAEARGNQAGTSFDPGTLEFATTYFWRIDEVNTSGITTGSLWSFTTQLAPPAPGQASAPGPGNGATDVGTGATLSWTAGSDTDSHDIYFGTNPSPGAGESRGNQTGASFDPGALASATTYYWRIDEVNASTKTTGTVWSFTTMATSDPVSLFSDGFESGNYATGNWTTADGRATVKGSAANSGAFGAELKRSTWIETSINTALHHSIHLTYSRMTSGLDSGELLYVEWLNGTTWTGIESVPNSAWTQRDWALPASAGDNADFKIRFRLEASANNEKARIDDVEVTGIPN